MLFPTPATANRRWCRLWRRLARARAGHKGFYALNAQMACDRHRRIIWCSTLCCGSTHDSAALNLFELGHILADDSHPIQAMFYWLAGDDAYKGPANNTCSLLTPCDCTGDDAKKKKREVFTSLHHAADWLAAHGVRVSPSTLYAMYYMHRWEGTERASGRNITPLPVHVQVCSTSDRVHLNRFM
eukprot:COSAG05_NODE_3059_length_2374_cov_1.259780_1_plen_185_part_00